MRMQTDFSRLRIGFERSFGKAVMNRRFLRRVGKLSEQQRIFSDT